MADDADGWDPQPGGRTFSLFKVTCPAEEAIKDAPVDVHTYNRWKKADRRLYRKLRAEAIAQKVATHQLQGIDDITSALESLSMLQTQSTNEDQAFINDLINQVQGLKLSSREPKLMITKKEESR